MLSSRCNVCHEPDEQLTDGVCEDCQLNIMLLALAKRCRDMPITTEYEAMKWLKMLKSQAIQILKTKEDVL